LSVAVGANGVEGVRPSCAVVPGVHGPPLLAVHLPILHIELLDGDLLLRPANL
jgi:hypothetical protein